MLSKTTKYCYRSAGTFLSSEVVLCLCILNLCFAATGLSATYESIQESSELIDPIDLLMVKSVKEINTHIPIQISKAEMEHREPKVNSSIAINFATQITERVSGSRNFLLSKSPGSAIQKELWQTRITASSLDQGDQDNEIKNDLRRIIEQVRATRLRSRNEISNPIIIIEPNFQAETEKPVAAKVEEPQHKMVAEEKKVSTESVEPQYAEVILEMFSELSKFPEQFKKPVELGDILYNGGYLEQAAFCYELALSEKMLFEDGANQDKAWVLFQVANCLQKKAPQVAMEKYQQLIEQFPNCPWIELAKAKSDLISWYITDDPVAMIKK